MPNAASRKAARSKTSRRKPAARHPAGVKRRQRASAIPRFVLRDDIAKNRYGQVPCLAAGKIDLCQSAEILEYLADALGNFSGRNLQEKPRAHAGGNAGVSTSSLP
jgi:hypothetical protein